MKKLEKEQPCDDMGGPCQWTYEDYNDDDEITSECFCRICFRPRDWKKEEYEE